MLAIDSSEELKALIDMIPHTADLRMRVSAESVEELFRESLRALMSCMEPQNAGETVERRHAIRIWSADPTSLLIDFLNDALTLAIINRETYTDAQFQELGHTELSATLIGIPAEFGEDIKAVTYHEAEIARRDDGSWSTLLVFDI